MALPTAAWPGYVYFYTLGDAPNVACVHVAEWWGLFRKLCIKRDLGDADPWQASGGDPNSSGTHTRGGALDWGGTSRARAMLAREAGAVAWPRAWSGNMHTHAVLDCPHNDPCAYQRTACIVYRRDGLGYKGLAGPDPLPAPSKWRTYQQGIDWMRAQLGLATTAEEDDMFTDQDREDLQYANKQNRAIAEAILALRNLLVKMLNDEDAENDAQYAALRALLEGQDVEDIWGRRVIRKEGNVPAIQELADIKTMLLEARDKGKL